MQKALGTEMALEWKCERKVKKCKSQFKEEIELSQEMEIRTTIEPVTACYKPRQQVPEALGFEDS